MRRRWANCCACEAKLRAMGALATAHATTTGLECSRPCHAKRCSVRCRQRTTRQTPARLSEKASFPSSGLGTQLSSKLSFDAGASCPTRKAAQLPKPSRVPKLELRNEGVEGAVSSLPVCALATAHATTPGLECSRPCHAKPLQRPLSPGAGRRCDPTRLPPKSCSSLQSDDAFCGARRILRS